MEAPFEFEVDLTALKVNKLEKLFKRAQGMNSIPDIEVHRLRSDSAGQMQDAAYRSVRRLRGSHGPFAFIL
ncbi:hypothetical protein ACSBR2_035518 [Camellia fascicularis]